MVDDDQVATMGWGLRNNTGDKDQTATWVGGSSSDAGEGRGLSGVGNGDQAVTQGTEIRQWYASGRDAAGGDLLNNVGRE